MESLSPGNPVVTSGGASIHVDAPAGLYELVAQLFDGEEIGAGTTKLIRVVPGHIAAGTRHLDIHLDPVDPALLLTAPALTPFLLSMGGYNLPLFLGAVAIAFGANGPGLYGVSPSSDSVSSYSVSAGALASRNHQIISRGVFGTMGDDGVLLDGLVDVAVSPDDTCIAVA